MPSPTSGTAWQAISLTGEPAIDAILAGTRWASGSLSYSFPGATASWSTSTTGGYGPIGGAGEPWSAEYAPLTATDQAAVRASLAAWSSVAKLTFTETADTATSVGTLRFAYTYTAEMEGAQAYAFLPGAGPIAGDVWFNSRGTSASVEWTRGSFEFMTVMHEIGHALGLKHPFSGTAGSPGVIDPQLDSRAFTIMSYSAQPGVVGSSFSFEPTTPMVLDVVAMQALYGANTATRSGNTTYSFGASNPVHQTIWDGGGIDTIVFNGGTHAEIDLRDGLDGGSSIGPPIEILDAEGLSLGTLAYNVWIAYGTVIENATGGSGGDSLIGTGAANRLDGRAGNDTIDGGAGNDTLLASLGSDVLRGGAGADTLSFASATLGVKANLALTAAQPTNQGQVTLASVEHLIGSPYADVLTGNAGANRIQGGAGNDVLTGAAGADTLVVGAGSDVIVLSSLVGADTVSGFASGVDDLRIRMSAIRVGDGDTLVEGALMRGAAGGFAPSAELVVFTANTASLSASAAAAAIGSATGSYAVGRTALFAVDNGSSSALFLFTAADANALVSASELKLLATLSGTASTALGDYVFGA